jgi:hypothetical protein
MNQRKPVAWRDPTNPTMICKDEHQLPLAEPVYAQMSHVTEPQSTEAMHGNNTVHRNGLCDVLRRHPRSGGGREDLEKLMAESQPRDGEQAAQYVTIEAGPLDGLREAVAKLKREQDGGWSPAARSQLGMIEVFLRMLSPVSERGPTIKALSQLEAEILIREHERMAHGCLVSDQFNAEREHEQRAAELRRAYGL